MVSQEHLGGHFVSQDAGFGGPQVYSSRSLRFLTGEDCCLHGLASCSVTAAGNPCISLFIRLLYYWESTMSKPNVWVDLAHQTMTPTPCTYHDSYRINTDGKKIFLRALGVEDISRGFRVNWPWKHWGKTYLMGKGGGGNSKNNDLT